MLRLTLPVAFNRARPTNQCIPCVSIASILATAALRTVVLLAVTQEDEFSFIGCLLGRYYLMDTNVIV